jgi:hypothetical protein
LALGRARRKKNARKEMADIKNALFSNVFRPKRRNRHCHPILHH